MKRILFAVIGLYIVTAIATTLAEADCGSKMRTDCWCKRPGLSLFRWVTPKDKHHLLTPADKQMLAEPQRGN